MHSWLHGLEVVVDRVIPPLLIALLLVLAGEIFLGQRFEAYSAYTDYFDVFIMLVFAADLSFKFHRIRKVPKFVRKYWIEIIATIPFFLIFRFIEFFGLYNVVERSQVVVHGISEVQKLDMETAAIVREAGGANRTARLIRTFRIASRFPRFLKALPFYEKPT